MALIAAVVLVVPAFFLVWRSSQQATLYRKKLASYERLLNYSFRRHLPNSVRVQVNRALLLGAKEFILYRVNVDNEPPFNLNRVVKDGVPGPAVEEFKAAIRGE